MVDFSGSDRPLYRSLNHELVKCRPSAFLRRALVSLCQWRRTNSRATLKLAEISGSRIVPYRFQIFFQSKLLLTKNSLQWASKCQPTSAELRAHKTERVCWWLGDRQPFRGHLDHRGMDGEFQQRPVTIWLRFKTDWLKATKKQPLCKFWPECQPCSINFLFLKRIFNSVGLSQVSNFKSNSQSRRCVSGEIALIETMISFCICMQKSPDSAH